MTASGITLWSRGLLRGVNGSCTMTALSWTVALICRHLGPYPVLHALNLVLASIVLTFQKNAKDSGEGVFFNNQHIKKLILHCKIVPSTPISGKGILVIGQEQDSLGGDFSSTEAFIGTLTLFNMWDRELPLSDVENMMVSCQDFHGNVISWQEVQKAMHGGVSAQPSTFCQGKVY